MKTNLCLAELPDGFAGIKLGDKYENIISKLELHWFGTQKIAKECGCASYLSEKEGAQIGLIFKNHPQVLTVRYEDLILDFISTMKVVYEFINLNIPETLHTWEETTNIRRSKHWDKPVQDLYHSSIGRWKNPEFNTRIEKFLKHPHAVRLLKTLGYE